MHRSFQKSPQNSLFSINFLNTSPFVQTGTWRVRSLWDDNSSWKRARAITDARKCGRRHVNLESARQSHPEGRKYPCSLLSIRWYCLWGTTTGCSGRESDGDEQDICRLEAVACVLLFLQVRQYLNYSGSLTNIGGIRTLLSNFGRSGKIGITTVGRVQLSTEMNGVLRFDGRGQPELGSVERRRKLWAGPTEWFSRRSIPLFSKSSFPPRVSLPVRLGSSMKDVSLQWASIHYTGCVSAPLLPRACMDRAL